MDGGAEKSFRFAAIGPESVLHVWDKAEPIIKRALCYDYDGMTTNQILARILLGDLELLLVERGGAIIAVMTLEYVQRQERICHCMTFSGDDMAEWVDEFIETWKRIAKETGCRYLSIKGRPGWQRYAARRYGFEHAYTQMYLEVD